MPEGLEGTEDRIVLMRTKLSVPGVPRRQVRRRRLVQVLDEGLTAKLSILCAATGWGKTSLLAEWAHTAETSFAWVSLDTGDDEPLRFWRYVVAAIGSVAAGAAAAAGRRLGAPIVSISEEVLPLLVNDLAALEQRLVLVLDDYHTIADPQIHTELRHLIDRMPNVVHIALATHTDPPLGLGRLRAMGELVELRDRELRFSDDEAAALLNRVHGLALSEQDLAVLQTRTEGWVAGLNLAALSMAGREDREDRHRVLDALLADERFLVDYLWDEVVLAQPREVRQFLMRTAILTRLTGPLCDAVAQRKDSDAMLGELARANLFVVSLDSGHEWFRYHYLFRELLLRQLRRFAPDLIPDLHRRASTWLAEHGLLFEAIDHAITAGDVHYAADEIERHWLEFYSTGQATTLLGWIDRLPADTIDTHPVLALVRGGIARAVGRLDEVEEWLARAESATAFADTPARGFGSSIASGAALARAMHRLALGDAPGAVRWARRAVALEPDESSREHATAAYFLGIALFYSDPDQAEPLLRGYLTAIPAGEDDVRRYYAMALLAEHHAVRGELDAAEQLANLALQVALANGLLEHPPTEQVHVALGAAHLARGRVDTAEEHLERAVALARRGGDRIEHAHALAWLARVRVDQRDPAGARDALERARELVPDAGRSILQVPVQMIERQLGHPRVHQDAPRSDQPLSKAELRVLRLLQSDGSYREIAAQLFLSHNTVRTHARHLRNKLNASNRAEAVAKARDQGLL
jgi:LuxR family transcriptional regulator, maltose regulon positive regulatory protein